MKRKIYVLCSIILVIACKKPYDPPVITSANSYLVVEGSINSGSDPTVFKLSRTVNLSNAVVVNPVTGAALTVEGDQNATYPLFETTQGTYTTGSGLNLDNNHKYRLRIKTADNKEYLSDFAAVLNSPPLDSISYRITGNGVNIYSNTHDPKNSTRYYRWDYQETWIFRSNFDSFFISTGDAIVLRDYINNQIYTCWKSDTSSTIIINSSAKLARDVIVDNPVTSIASSSEKIGSEYSILVRQYALTGDAYNFWQNIKKNTEQLGSIFDAEPSQLIGNIHSTTNPTEAVIGYISVGSTSSARIFIGNQQLPAWPVTPFYPECKLDTFLFKYLPPGSQTYVNQVQEYLNYPPGGGPQDLIINAIGRPGQPPIGYTGSSHQCVDCTLRGTNVQPSFWK